MQTLGLLPWSLAGSSVHGIFHWGGLPFPSPGDLPNLGFKPRSPTWQTDALPSRPRGSTSKALAITYYLLCAWRPQSSGKEERANQFLKSVIKKIIQETFLRLKEALPIAPLCTHIVPKEQIGLSPSEVLYGRPFIYVNDLFLDPETQTLWSYAWSVGNSNKKYVYEMSTRTQKILKDHHNMPQGFKSY